MESYIYLPLLEESAICRARSIRPRPRYSPQPGHRPEIRPLPQCLFPDRGDAPRLGRSKPSLDYPHQSRRRDSGPLRRHGKTVALHRPKLPGIPGVETFAGHSFHTAAGITPIRAAARKETRGCTTRSSALSARCHRGAVRPASGRCAKHLYVFPAHAVLDRRSQQSGRQIPEWAASLQPAMAEATHGQFQHARDRRYEPRISSPTAGPRSSVI